VKRLTLVRHGHAEPNAAGGDFHRALSAQGRTEVLRSAAAIKATVPEPDTILASEANRTRETAEVLQAHLGVAAIVLTSKRLYHANWPTVLEVISDTPEDVTHLLLVGHNPGLSELALRWAQLFPAYATFGGFATAGWCSVTFGVTDWRSIRSPLDAVFG
jgi:phosphohistidine phosphatase